MFIDLHISIFLDDILKYFKVYVMVSPKDSQLIEDPFQEMIDEHMKIKKMKEIEKKK